MTTEKAESLISELIRMIVHVEFTTHRIVIQPGTEFWREGFRPFRLYVPREASVSYITAGGDKGTETLGSGYHRSEFIHISDTTAPITACFND